MSDILVRLHEAGLGWGVGPALVCQEAEAEIARLRSELAKAREERQQAWEENLAFKDGTEYRILKAELSKARKALEEIAETDVIYPPHDPGNYFAPEGRDGPCAKIARAALAPQTEGE